MKRRALLSGIVPAVAGAAGACRSSVANVLTGGVPSSASGTLPTKEIAWLLAVQWFHTLSRNSAFLRVPHAFKAVGKNNECMRNGVAASRVVQIPLASVYAESKHGAKCIGWFADTLVIENIGLMIDSLKSTVFNSIDVPRHKAIERVVIGKKITQAKPVEYHVDVEGDPEIDFRRYYVSVDNKIPMSLDVAFESMQWEGDIEDASVNIRIEVKIAVDQHVGKITCIEGCWGGVRGIMS